MDTQDLALQQEETDPVTPPTEEQAEESETKPQDELSEEGSEEAQEATDEIRIEIEGEEPPPVRGPAPGWVRELREQQRVLKARNAELERALAARGEAEKPLTLGEKPTLDGCDYDPARFEQELEGWHERKQLVSQKEAQVQATQEQHAKQWSDKQEAYAKGRVELSKQIPSFAEAEATVASILDITQQGVIVAAADNPAMVVCALGQNPKLAQELAAERDPIKFAVKMAKLEAKLKMAKKNSAPSPERPLKGSGSGSMSGSGDAQLERLRAAADKSGDYSQVVAYKNRLRNASK